MSKVDTENNYLATGERRESPRHEFGLVQQVAEYDGEASPDADDFRRVQIVDVSCDGFSFYTLAEPQGENVVVVMGDPPKLNCHVARVVYYTPLNLANQVFYRVGCQIVGDGKLDVNAVIQQRDNDTVRLLRELTGLAECAELAETD